MNQQKKDVYPLPGSAILFMFKCATMPITDTLSKRLRRNKATLNLNQDLCENAEEMFLKYLSELFDDSAASENKKKQRDNKKKMIIQEFWDIVFKIQHSPSLQPTFRTS